MRNRCRALRKVPGKLVNNSCNRHLFSMSRKNGVFDEIIFAPKEAEGRDKKDKKDAFKRGINEQRRSFGQREVDFAAQSILPEDETIPISLATEVGSDKTIAKHITTTVVTNTFANDIKFPITATVAKKKRRKRGVGRRKKDFAAKNVDPKNDAIPTTLAARESKSYQPVTKDIKLATTDTVSRKAAKDEVGWLPVEVWKQKPIQQERSRILNNDTIAASLTSEDSNSDQPVTTVLTEQTAAGTNDFSTNMDL